MYTHAHILYVKFFFISIPIYDNSYSQKNIQRLEPILISYLTKCVNNSLCNTEITDLR